MQKKHTLSTVFISTAAQGVKKNNVFTQSIFSRARATTLLWRPGSALSPLIKQSFGMAFSSSFIHSTRYCEVKILWKNLDRLCQLAVINFLKGLCDPYMVPTYLLGFWRCWLNQGAIFSIQSFAGVKVCVWRGKRTVDNALGVFVCLREMGMKSLSPMHTLIKMSTALLSGL